MGMLCSYWWTNCADDHVCSPRDFEGKFQFSPGTMCSDMLERARRVRKGAWPHSWILEEGFSKGNPPASSADSLEKIGNVGISDPRKNDMKQRQKSRAALQDRAARLFACHKKKGCEFINREEQAGGWPLCLSSCVSFFS